MQLRDMYTEDELPTRPGTPDARRAHAARRCKFCRKVYGEHAEIFPTNLDAECFGVQCNFEPEEMSDADRAR